MTTSLGVLLAVLAAGSMTGAMAGLLGVGGGTILVPFLLWYYHLCGVPEAIAVKMALGTSLSVMILGSIITMIVHRKRDNLSFTEVYQIASGVVFGSFVGMATATLIDHELFKCIFGFFEITVATKMLYDSGSHSKAGERTPRTIEWRGYALMGLFIGTFSAMFGVGGGIVTVPLMIYFAGASYTRAVAISSGVIFATSLTGTVMYAVSGALAHVHALRFSVGYVDFGAALLLSVGSVIVSGVSASYLYRVNQRILKLLFSILLIGLGVNFVVRYFA